MKTAMTLFAVLLLVSGCGFKEYNSMVARQNALMVQAFGHAMAEQTSESGRLAVALMFATGAGRQKLAKPETAATYIPMISTVALPWANLFWHRSDDDTNTNYSAGGDIYVQATNNSNHGGSEMISSITGTGNHGAQTITPAPVITPVIVGGESGEAPTDEAPAESEEPSDGPTIQPIEE